MVNIFVSTGEVSGDLQGGLLVRALRQQAQARGWDLTLTALGGEQLANAGAQLLANTAAIGSVGLTESLRFILPTWQIRQRVKRYFQEHPVDLLILIDYMGPNLGIAADVRRAFPHIPIIYYIAPQAWVWSPSAKDTQRLVRSMDQLLAIFPQEAQFFAAQGVPVTWVGHPLLDRLAQAPTRWEARAQLGLREDQTVITLLPASRVQEVKSLLPILCQAAQQLQNQLPNVQLLLPVSLEAYREDIRQTLNHYNLQVVLLDGQQTLTAIAAADLALCKSGTVNLEIALLNVPQVVVYKVSPLTRWLAQWLLKFDVAFVSPANIVLGQEIVPELLQERATAANIVPEALDLLLNPDRRQTTLDHYQQLRQALGERGVCERAAQVILDTLSPTVVGQNP